MSLGLTVSSRLIVLGSGSGGNAVVVDGGAECLLIDAGFSCRELEARMARAGVDREKVAAVLLTHEHSDHTKGAARFSRRHRVPVWATAGTQAEIGLAASGIEVRTLRAGCVEHIGPFAVEPFAVPHDAREPVGFVVEHAGGQRIGLAADLGTRRGVSWDRLQDLDALILETNHDLEMLRTGPYPWPLKQRVAGGHGHLSNCDAAAGLPELLSERLRWVVLYHLSRTNNRPELALEAVGEALAREGSNAEICVTSQFEPTPWLATGPETVAP